MLQPASSSENPVPPPPSQAVPPPPLSQLAATPPPPPTPESEFTEDNDMVIRMPPVINATEIERKLNWPKIIVTSCIAAALVIPFHSEYYSSSFTGVLSCIAFSLSLLCTSMDNIFGSGFPTLRQVLGNLAIFFLIDSFLLALTHKLSPLLKSIIWTLYIFSFLIVLVSKWLKIIKD